MEYGTSCLAVAVFVGQGILSPTRAGRGSVLDVLSWPCVPSTGRGCACVVCAMTVGVLRGNGGFGGDEIHVRVPGWVDDPTAVWMSGVC